MRRSTAHRTASHYREITIMIKIENNTSLMFFLQNNVNKYLLLFTGAWKGRETERGMSLHIIHYEMLCCPRGALSLPLSLLLAREGR